MLVMANHAYVSMWCQGFSETTMLERFKQLLETVPFSPERPGFTSLVIRALGPAEAPLVDQDLRGCPLSAAELVQIAAEHRHSDSAYEVQTHWNLWVYDPAQSSWQLRPQPLEIICYAEEYDESASSEVGHFLVDIGFEHVFTGHAGLLGARRQPVAAPQHPAEAEFLNRMAKPENLRLYHEKTRENICKLLGWVEKVQSTLPLDRYWLWSEGEDNFEARLEEILAVR